MKQLIEVLAGRPGAGKTETMLKQIVQHPGRYLLACPRFDLIQSGSLIFTGTLPTSA